MQLQILSRLLLILALLSLTACPFKKSQPAPMYTVIEPPSTTEIESADQRSAQVRGHYQDVIQQLRKNPYLRVNETDPGTIIAQVRSGNVFRTSGTQVSPQMQPVFEHIAATWAAYPWLDVRVIGHTDNIGAPDQNLQLSVYRAQSVRDALVTLGIDATKISYEGRGDTEPLASNTSAEGRAVNRRIDLLFTGTPPAPAQDNRAGNTDQ